MDDSASMDNEIFNLEEFEGADWVLISDDLPVDEAQRDELLEDFQAAPTAATAGAPRPSRTPRRPPTSVTPRTTSRRPRSSPSTKTE